MKFKTEFKSLSFLIAHLRFLDEMFKNLFFMMMKEM